MVKPPLFLRLLCRYLPNARSRRRPGSMPASTRTIERWLPACAGIYLLRDIADHREHRVADILDPFRQHAGLDRLEAGMAQVALDQPEMTAIVERAPDRHRLGPEAAI